MFEDEESEESLAPLSRFRLLALSTGLLGIQVCFAVRIGNATRTLLVLGMPDEYVSYVWLSGPIAGIFVQPIVGMMSDNCQSRFGRRTPFLIAGTVFTALSMLGFAWSDYFPNALPVAVVSFGIIDVALNMLLGPLRALIADIVPKEQQPQVNSYLALMTGLGNLIGSGAGSIELSSYLKGFPDDETALYSLAAIFVSVFMAVTIFVSEEVPLSYEETECAEDYAPIPANNEGKKFGFGTFISFLKDCSNAPSSFAKLFTIQCCTWFGWFTTFVFLTSWVGTTVYKGDPNSKDLKIKKNYEAGVRAGNLGLTLSSVVTVLFSLGIPHIIEYYGTTNLYIASHVLFGLSLAATSVTTNKYLAILEIAAHGIPWAITMAIPWTIMGQAVAKKSPGKEGFYLTLFGLSQCLPDFMVSIASEVMLKDGPHSQANNSSFILLIGGLAAFCGALLIFVLRKDDDLEIVTTDENTLL